MGKLQVTNTNNNQKANLYLTNVLYNDEERQTTAEVLSSIPSLLSDHIPIVVDCCMGRPTGDTNFEVAWYNYSPIAIQRGSGLGS